MVLSSLVCIHDPNFSVIWVVLESLHLDAGIEPFPGKESSAFEAARRKDLDGHGVPGDNVQVSFRGSFGGSNLKRIRALTSRYLRGHRGSPVAVSPER